MSNDFEREMFEWKQARSEEKRLLEHMCVDLELVNTQNHPCRSPAVRSRRRTGD